jgi:hypothetical protein
VAVEVVFGDGVRNNNVVEAEEVEEEEEAEDDGEVGNIL